MLPIEYKQISFIFKAVILSLSIHILQCINNSIMKHRLWIPKTLGNWQILHVDVLDEKLFILLFIYVDMICTLEYKTHFWVLIIGLLIVSSVDKYLLLVESSPSTTTQKSKLSLNLFNNRINFSPKIRCNVINLYIVTIFTFCIHTPKFYEIIFTYWTQRRIKCSIFTRRHWLTLICFSVKYLTFF